MSLKGTFRDGVIIPDRSDALRNGDVVDILAIRQTRKAITLRVRKPTKRKPKRLSSRQRLAALMSAFGSLANRSGWKGRSSSEIARDLRGKASTRIVRG